MESDAQETSDEEPFPEPAEGGMWYRMVAKDPLPESGITQERSSISRSPIGHSKEVKPGVEEKRLLVDSTPEAQKAGEPAHPSSDIGKMEEASEDGDSVSQQEGYASTSSRRSSRIPLATGRLRRTSGVSETTDAESTLTDVETSGSGMLSTDEGKSTDERSLRGR